jgi:two-component system chemotaxis response regulator CheB
MISSVTQRSSQAAVEALAEGAVEVLAKPDGPYSVGDFRFTLGQKVRNAASARVRSRRAAIKPNPLSPPPVRAVVGDYTSGNVKLIAIGASTGGTEAIERIIRPLPATMPPIVVVQHIPAGFSKAFADRLDRLCALHVKEAVNGDIASPGLVLVAPGSFHMRVVRMGQRFRVSVADGPMVCYQRPAVDVLFDSIAENSANGAVAVLLTGMGSDGAAGMKRMKLAGAHTLAQNERSCAVFGMPREAIRLGGVDEVLSLDVIGPRLLAACAAGIPRVRQVVSNGTLAGR